MPHWLFPLTFGLLTLATTQAEDWPQWRGPRRDATWQEADVLQTFPAGGLKVRWRVPLGMGHSSPIVAGGRVYATDARTEVPNSWERIHCWDEKTGDPLWTFEDKVDEPDLVPDNPPRPIVTPLVSGGFVFGYSLKADLWCLDARTGKLLWKRAVGRDYGMDPGMEMTACPVAEGGLIIVLTGGKPGGAVAAFEQRTGCEVWRALDDPFSFSSPMLITAGGRRQLILWTPQAVTSLDPATGKVWWRHEVAIRQDYVVATPVAEDHRLLISGMMFDLVTKEPKAALRWPQAESLSKQVLSHTSTPLLTGGHVYSGKLGGKLVCLNAATGEQVWESDQPTKLAHCATLHLTWNRGTCLLFTDQGNLIRARLSPQGYDEISRAPLIVPTYTFAGRKLVWAAPAFANGHVFARNDKELICVSLKSKPAAK